MALNMSRKRNTDENDSIIACHVLPKSNISPASRSRMTSESRRNSQSPRSQDSSVSDASIVLIGIRGTGKSSLAVMASSALGFRVIDADQHFFKATGLSRAAFNAKHGVQEYKRRELHIMHSVLLENQSRCVITCGPGSVEGKGQDLLREYSKTHPVIYVLRDTDDIQRYLRAWDAETISNLVELTTPSYRASSSFEFYNISESRSPGTHDTATSHPSLTLKNLQQDFLRLIYFLTNQTSRHIGHSISLLPPESKEFTYALSLPLSLLQSVITRLPDLMSTADAVTFLVDIPLLANGQRTFNSAVANNISKHFYLVRRYLQIPMIFKVLLPVSNLQTIERVELEEAYFEILRFGLRIAPDYICVDLTCSDQRIQEFLAGTGFTKTIGCFSDTDPGADGWATQDRKQKLRRSEELGCQMVWLCQEATSMLDNISLQRFTYDVKASNNSTRSVIAYNTGRLGRMSCWQNTTLAPVTHSVLRSLNPNPAADSLITVKEAQNALYSSFTLDKMFFGVLGATVANSISPAMHNAGYAFCGMPHEYRVFQTSSLREMEQYFRDHHFGGLSLSSPFKREMALVVEHMSEEARAIGAVNTLIPLRRRDMPHSLLERNRAGPIVAFYGECTDWIGIYNCVSRSLSPVNTVNSRTTAVVLGAGGMARAAIYALIRLGVQTIFICNRTVKKAEEVVDHFLKWSSREKSLSASSNQDPDNTNETASNRDRMSVRTLNIATIATLKEPWPANTDPPTIVVSALPGCNRGDSVPIDNSVPSDWFSSKTGGVAVELAYEPLETPLLEQARASSHRGWIMVNGLQHVLEQGFPQFELFTGRKAPEDVMRVGALKGYEEVQKSTSSWTSRSSLSASAMQT